VCQLGADTGEGAGGAIRLVATQVYIARDDVEPVARVTVRRIRPESISASTADVKPVAGIALRSVLRQRAVISENAESIRVIFIGPIVLERMTAPPCHKESVYPIALRSVRSHQVPSSDDLEPTVTIVESLAISYGVVIAGHPNPGKIGLVAVAAVDDVVTPGDEDPKMDFTSVLLLSARVATATLR
jgi:hypothetical protein